MKQIRNFLMALLGILMCLCLSSCTIQGEETDEGIDYYIVKSEIDYSDFMCSHYYINENRDTLISKLSKSNSHQYLYSLKNGYYRIARNPEKMVILSIKRESWTEDMNKENYPLEEYVMIYDPFIEIYLYKEKYSEKDLIDIIDQDQLYKLKKIK